MKSILSSFTKRSITTVLVTILFTGVSLVDGELQAAGKDYQQAVAAVEANVDGLPQVLALGRETADTCSLCHGNDGNSVKPGVPSLAGQNPGYLFMQFEKFASGERIDFTGVMQTMVGELSDEQRIALAIFYSRANLQPQPFDAELAAKGRPLFDRVCKNCHGADGSGSNEYARIAGQRTDYVIETLKLFRDGKSNKWRSRQSSLMTTFTKNLSDEEIINMANFIASLNSGS